MSQQQALEICSFFLNFEAEMMDKGRTKVAAFARRQHQKYYQKYINLCKEIFK